MPARQEEPSIEQVVGVLFSQYEPQEQGRLTYLSEDVASGRPPRPCVEDHRAEEQNLSRAPQDNSQPHSPIALPATVTAYTTANTMLSTRLMPRGRTSVR